MEVWTAADGFSGATPLGALATAPVGDTVYILTNYSWWDCFLGYTQGSMGETSTLACLLGAIGLIYTGVGSWRIMAGVVLGATVASTLLWVSSGSTALMSLPPWWHFVIGGFAFGTVYMATDPVSAAMTETGRWWYGGLIGVMTVLIRVINPAFPEGIMLAILFGNVMAPLIDYFVIQANIKRRMARYVAE
jgi:Na+-transporting NADH:ubiquinone oxidoreductase subunit B